MNRNSSFTVTKDGEFKTEDFSINTHGRIKSPTYQKGLLSTDGFSDLPIHQPITVSDIVTLGEIGRGQNGSVLKAMHMPTLTLTAVKTIDVYSKNTRHQLVKELKAFSTLHFLLYIKNRILQLQFIKHSISHYFK